MKRSSDYENRDTEADKGVDFAAQWIVESGEDWRRPYYGRRGVCWAELKRCGEARVG